MSCPSCERIRAVIKLPKDLRAAINLANSKQKDGTLSYLGHGDHGDPFQRIANGGHWGDFVNNYFKCNQCGQLFNLYAETYHGSGGKLHAVEKVEGKLHEAS